MCGLTAAKPHHPIAGLSPRDVRAPHQPHLPLDDRLRTVTATRSTRLQLDFSTMSEAYERERQNNSRLEELSSKVSALRGVTVDIYDNARSHEIIDSSNEVFSSLSTSLKSSAGRVTRMAGSGNKVAIFKLAAMIVGVVILLWWIWGFFI